jgi:hypothetical protein
MKKKLLFKVAVVFALILSCGPAQPASAYPPGRSLSMSVDTNLAQYRSKGIHLVAEHLAPTPFTFAVNGNISKRFPTKKDGNSESWFFYPSRPGRFDITATSGSESRSTTVWVPLQPKLPRAISVRKGFPIHLKYVAPGTVVAVFSKGRVFDSAAADANGNLDLFVPGGSLQHGKQSLYLNYGGAFTGGGKVKGLK